MKTGSILAVAVCALLAACQSAPKPETKTAASLAHEALVGAAEAWVKSELFFGLAPWEAEGLGLAAAEGTWRAFLDEEVTPRFPDGFTVLDGYGQWRADARSGIERSRSRVLVIVHPATAAKRAGLEAICEAYKARTGEKSVLVIETPVAPPRF